MGIGASSPLIRREPKVPRVGQCQESHPDQLFETAFGEHEDVVDDLIGRSYLVVDVVPGEFHDLEEVKSEARPVAPEFGRSALFALPTSLGSSNHHCRDSIEDANDSDDSHDLPYGRSAEG